jgi:hypothetical protein
VVGLLAVALAASQRERERRLTRGAPLKKREWETCEMPRNGGGGGQKAASGRRTGFSAPMWGQGQKNRGDAVKQPVHTRYYASTTTPLLVPARVGLP